MRIRKATLEDREALARMHRDSISTLCAGHYTPEQIASWTGCITTEAYDRALRDKVFLVAVDQGALLGLGMLDAQAGEVNALYVSPGAVGHGLGGELLKALEREAVGLDRLTLRSTLNAQGFYARHGYRALEPDEHQLPDGTRLACVLMAKALG